MGDLDEAEAALAALIGDVYRRYNLGPVRRSATRGVGLHRDWVPTECAGPYITGNIDQIITGAELVRTGGATPVIRIGEDMHHVIVQGTHHYTVGKGFIHHMGTKGQVDIVPRILGKTDTPAKAEFDELLQSVDVPLGVYRWQDGAVLDPQSVQFTRNGSWSSERQILGAAGVRDHNWAK